MDRKGKIHVFCGNMLEALKEKVSQIEIYYNPLTTIIETDIKEAKLYHIVTHEEISKEEK